MMFIFNPPIICIQKVFFVKEVLSFVLWLWLFLAGSVLVWSRLGSNFMY